MSQGRVIDIIIIGGSYILQFLERHTDHRNLDGIYTDVFWGLRERKKSLKEIFFKMLLRKKQSVIQGGSK